VRNIHGAHNRLRYNCGNLLPFSSSFLNASEMEYAFYWRTRVDQNFKHPFLAVTTVTTPRITRWHCAQCTSCKACRTQFLAAHWQEQTPYLGLTLYARRTTLATVHKYRGHHSCHKNSWPCKYFFSHLVFWPRRIFVCCLWFRVGICRR